MSKLENLKELKDRLDIKVYDKEKIPMDAPSIIITNKNGCMGAIYLPTAFDKDIVSLLPKNIINQVGMEELLDRYVNLFPFPEDTNYEDECLDYANRLLLEGISIHMFPERRNNNQDRKIHKGSTSAIKLLFKSLDYYNFVYLLPVAIYTNNKNVVRMHVLDSINPVKYYREYNAGNKESMQKLIDEGMSEIASVLKLEYLADIEDKKIKEDIYKDKEEYEKDLKNLSLKMIKEYGDRR